MLLSLWMYLAQYGGGGGTKGGSYGGGGYSAGYWIVVAIIAVVVIAAIVWAVRAIGARRMKGTPSRSDSLPIDRAA